MAFGQVFKKRSGGPAENNTESAFSVGDANIEIPDIDEVMKQIDRTLQKTVPVQEVIETRKERGCGCWG